MIGSGKIGANVAVHLALKELDDLTLVDVVQGLPQGEAMDIQHMVAAYGLNLDVRGSNDYRDIEGSEIVVVAAGFGRKPGQTRLDLMNSNASIIRDVCRKIGEHASNSVLVMVTNPLDVMTYIALRTTGFPRHRVVGMSGTLDGARLRHFVARELSVSNSSVNPMVVGEHGENMIPLYEYSSVSGAPLSQFIDRAKFGDLAKKTREVAADVIAKKGATIHGPAAAVTVLVQSIVNDSHSLLNASAALEGEYGFKDVVMNVPVVVSSRGVDKIVELKLSDEEKALMDTAYKTIRDAISKLNTNL